MLIVALLPGVGLTNPSPHTGNVQLASQVGLEPPLSHASPSAELRVPSPQNAAVQSASHTADSPDASHCSDPCASHRRRPAPDTGSCTSRSGSRFRRRTSLPSISGQPGTIELSFTTGDWRGRGARRLRHAVRRARPARATPSWTAPASAFRVHTRQVARITRSSPRRALGGRPRRIPPQAWRRTRAGRPGCGSRRDLRRRRPRGRPRRRDLLTFKVHQTRCVLPWGTGLGRQYPRDETRRCQLHRQARQCLLRHARKRYVTACEARTTGWSSDQAPEEP